MSAELRTRFDTAKASPGFLLWSASNLLQRLHGATLKPFGLTPAQFSVLASIVYLSKHEKRLTQAILGGHTGLEKMFISDLTKTLAAKGWIRVVPHPEDGRAKVLVPTKRGVDKINAAIGPIEALDVAFFARLEDPKSFAADLARLLTSPEP